MNLHGIVAPYIGIVNPFIDATLKQSAGYTTNPDGTQVPAYTLTPISIQVQALSGGDLQKLAGLNIQGINNAVYISGEAEAVDRVNRKGGDLLVFNKQSWLVVTILEDWPNWCKVAVVLQNGS